MKKHIVTFYDESFSDIKDIILNRLENYSKKCDAELIVVKDWNVDKGNNFLLNRLNHMNMIAKDGRYLFIDMDTLVRNDTPDLFNLVPDNKLGVFNEGGNWLRSVMVSVNEMQVRHENVFANSPQVAYLEYNSFNKEMNLGIDLPAEFTITYNKPYDHYNMGVMVCSSTLMKKFKLSSFIKPKNYEILNKYPIVDQLLFNLLIRKHSIPVYELPSCFNCFYGYRTSDYLKRNFINHYCGVPNEERFEIIKRDHEILCELGF
jgi:lipopolysaccharide biosynthesis glycosyltransferase